MKQKLVVQIVTWNSDKFLKDCLDSLFSQTYRNFSVLVIDNGSNDRTLKILKQDYSQEKIKKVFKRRISKLFVFENKKNLGFSKAHNQGFNLIDSEYVLALNPDIVLEKDFLTNLMEVAEKEKRVGSLGGKLLQIKSGEVYGQKIKTEIIDSTGFSLLRNYHIIDRGQGRNDKNQYNKKTKVFGISGACVLYKRKALEDIKIGEYFDEDFFAYQEDMDMAWRLQLRGWNSIFVPEAKAYHFRGTGLKEKPKLKEILKAHQNRSRRVEFFSFRNHLWFLLKNIYWSNLFLNFFHIFFYQLGKGIYLFFFKPGVFFKASFSFWKGFGKMLKKRKIIMKRAKIKPKAIKKWINNARFYE